MPCQNHPDVHDGLVQCWRCHKEFCAANCAIELQHYWFCADCKTPQVRDILAGTDMSGPDYASLDKRFGAWMLDGLIKFGISFGISQVGQFITLTFAKSTSPGINLWAAGMLLFFSMVGYLVGMVYEGLMLAQNKGQTLGKMALKIRVVTAEGNPISKRQAWWRAVLKLLFFCFGCETCVGVMIDGIFALGQEHASLHDLSAKTRVVCTD